MKKVYELIQPRAEAVAYLKQLLTGNGMTWREEEPVNQGYGVKIGGEDQGTAFSGVLYFNKQGFSSKVIIDKGSERLFQLLDQQLASLAKGQASADEPAILKQLMTEAHLGTDESGKGDYFGPLVVAGVYVQPQDMAALREMGVADSKTLSEKKIRTIADSLRTYFQNRFEVLFIKPEKYNELYAKIGNLNKLLAWGHARVMENLLGKLELSKTGKLDCRYALADKFGDEGLIQRALMQKGRRIRLVQIPRGERDLAVAAASIIARDLFVHKMEEQSQYYGVTLPKGCNEMVRKAAEQIVAQYGQGELAKVAKLHFKTAQEICGN